MSDPTPDSVHEAQKLAEAYDVVLAYAASGALCDEETANLFGSGPRIVRGLQEMIWPRLRIIDEVRKAMETVFPVSAIRTQPVMVGPIDTHSLCPHHFLPIINRVYIGYVQDKRAIGLSKLPRIADALARRAVIQEQYTADIYKLLTTGHLASAPNMQWLSPSVVVNVRAEHHCMICRGVQGRATTATEMVGGEFQTNSNTYGMFSRFCGQGSGL